MATSRTIGLLAACAASAVVLAACDKASPSAPASSHQAPAPAVAAADIPPLVPVATAAPQGVTPAWLESPLEPLASPPKLVQGKFNSARACGACHQAIFDRWSKSMHANSFVDPVFRSALYKAHYESQGAAAAICLRCHSPTVTVSKDFYGTGDVSREGVTCDFCHTVGALTESASGVQYTLDWTQKHGPYQKTSSPAHAVGYRPFFETSEFCGGCHDMSTADGTVVFSTYSEWKASKYAKEGRQCHDCHMPRLSGPTVKEGKDTTGHDVFNDHRLFGGHEPTQVKRAVTIKVESLTRDAERVQAVISVENSGAGHFVPTGIPSRKLVLTVTATQRGRSIFRREVVYQRVMQDDHDRTLTEDWEIKLLSKRVLRDNRIAPLENRRETFVFDASALDDVELSAQLAYVYDPGNSANYHMDVTIAETGQILGRGL